MGHHLDRANIMAPFERLFSKVHINKNIAISLILAV